MVVQDFFRLLLVHEKGTLAMKKETIAHFIKNALIKIHRESLGNFMALKPLIVLGNQHCPGD